jgi:hypothetical protein
MPEDAEGVDESAELGRASSLDRKDEVLGGAIGEPLQAQEVLARQREQIGHVAHAAARDELPDRPLPEAADVERIARREVSDRALELCPDTPARSDSYRTDRPRRSGRRSSGIRRAS